MKEEVEIIYLLARRGLKWVRGHGRWFRLMEGRGLRGRLVANGNRKPWVSIKPPVPLFHYRFIEVVTAMDCCPGDLMLLHKARLLSCARSRHDTCFIRSLVISRKLPLPPPLLSPSRRGGTPRVNPQTRPDLKREERVSRRQVSFDIIPASESSRECVTKCQKFQSWASRRAIDARHTSRQSFMIDSTYAK